MADISKLSDGTTTYNIKDAVARANIPGQATTSTLGTVKPDGTTITIDNNGVISAAGSSTYAMVIIDYTDDEDEESE